MSSSSSNAPKESMRERFNRARLPDPKETDELFCCLSISRNEQNVVEVQHPKVTADGLELSRKMVAQKADVCITEIKKGSYKAIKFPVHDEKGITCFILLYGRSIPQARARRMVERMTLVFHPFHESLEWEDGSKPDLKGMEEMLQRELHYANSKSAVDDVNEKISEVMEIMRQNVDRVLERSEKIELLEGKANNLSKAADVFQKTGKRLKRFHLMNKVKYGVVVGTAVTGVIALPIVVIVLA